MAGSLPVVASEYTSIVDAVNAVNNGTDTSATYNVTADTNVYDKSNADTTYGYGVVNGTLNIVGTNSQTANVYGTLAASPLTTNPDATPKIVVKNVGYADASSLGSDYSLTVKSKWTNLTPSVGAPYAALAVQHGTLDISNSVFAGSRNVSTTNVDGLTSDNGGAIQTKGDSILKVDGSIFYDNQAETSYGGAIDIDGTNDKATITNSAFIKNWAGLHAGAIDIHSTDVQLTDNSFYDNSASWGGAVYVHEGASTDIKTTNAAYPTLFEANEALEGGAIYGAATSDINIEGAVFNKNQALSTASDAADGSAIYSAGVLTTKNSTFKNNEVTGSNALGGTVYIHENGLYVSTGDTFTANTVSTDGGAVLNKGTTTLKNTTIENNKATGNGGAVYNAGQLKITGTTTMSGNVAKIGSNLYNTGTGTVDIVDVHDNVDLDYNPFTVTTAPSSSRTLFDQKGDIYNAGTMNITNSDLQLHNGINTNTALTETEKKVGTVNIANSRIDLGGSGVAGDGTIYADTVNIKAGSKIQTHVSTNASGSHGKISANDITVSADNTSLGIIVGVGELAAGEKREYEVLDAKNGVSGEFENIANNKLYDIAAKGDGVYEISRKKEFCPDGNCDPNESATAKGWIDGTAITGNEVATNIQDKLNTLWQSDGCSDEVKTALDGLAPDVSPLIQAHATEITRRLSAVISERFYNSMERTGYVHRGKRFYRFPRHDSNLWVQGLYGKSKYDVRKGWDMDTKGIAVGFDGHVTDALRMGVSYAYTKADGDSVGRETTIDSHTGTIYGEYNPNRYYANWLAMYTRSEYDEDKKVFDHRVSANYDVDAIGAQVMLGRKMGPYVQEDWASGVIKPEIGMRYLYTKQHEYTDSVGQKVGSADGHTLTGILGAQYTIGYTLSPTLSWYPELRAALTYDFIEPDTSMRVNLLNGSTYTVKTENMDRLGIEVGARVGLDINRKAEISLEYEGLFKGDYTNHTGLANLKYKF